MSVSQPHWTSLQRQIGATTVTGVQYYETVSNLITEMTRSWVERVTPFQEEFTDSLLTLRHTCEMVMSELEERIELERTAPVTNTARLAAMRAMLTEWNMLLSGLPSPDEDQPSMEPPDMARTMETLAHMSVMPRTLEEYIVMKSGGSRQGEGTNV